MRVYFPLPYHRVWYARMVGMFDQYGNDHDLLIFITRALRAALTGSHDSEELVNMLSVEFTAGPYRILDEHAIDEDDVGGIQNWFWNAVDLACADLAEHFEQYLVPVGTHPRWSYSFLEMQEDYICFNVEVSRAPACLY